MFRLYVSWDPVKAHSNLRKHRVTFEQASTALNDPLASSVRDADHSEYEERWVTLGRTAGGMLRSGGTDRCLIINVQDNIDNFEGKLAFSDLDWLWGLMRGAVRQSVTAFVSWPTACAGFPRDFTAKDGRRPIESPVSLEAATRSKCTCKLSQNSGSTPNQCPSLNAVSPVTERFPLMI